MAELTAAEAWEALRSKLPWPRLSPEQASALLADHDTTEATRQRELRDRAKTAEVETSRLRTALEMACRDAWADGPAAVRHYLDLADTVLPPPCRPGVDPMSAGFATSRRSPKGKAHSAVASVINHQPQDVRTCLASSPDILATAEHLVQLAATLFELYARAIGCDPTEAWTEFRTAYTKERTAA